MRVNYQVNATPLFRVLSEDQIEEIYLATLEVLARTGTRVYEAEALELLRGGGAIISDTNLVHIPSFMVKAALETTPERITLTGRDGRKKVLLEKDHIYFGTGSDCPFVADPRTNERRRFTYQDVYNAAKITDALPNIDFHMSVGLTSNVPIGTYDRHQFLAMVSGTTKPLVITAVDREGLADQYQMACAILGGEDEWRKNPLFVIYIEPSSPLNNSEAAVQKVLYAAEKSIPAIYTPCVIMSGGCRHRSTQEEGHSCHHRWGSFYYGYGLHGPLLRRARVGPAQRRLRRHHQVAEDTCLLHGRLQRCQSLGPAGGH